MRTTILIFMALLAAGSRLTAQITSQNSAPEAVPIIGTQLLHMKSAIVDQEYDLYINLPRNYSDKSKTFPVLYLTDAQWDFPLVQSIYGQQYYDGFVPGIVIVGITWGGKNPDYDMLRRRDFTPSFVQQSQPSGNAAKFLECIKKEIIPMVESKYRVTNDRTLMGSSLGGLFALYTLFTQTDLFGRYVLTSPALGWDNGLLYKIEKSYSENNTTLPAKLFMGIGGYEDTVSLENFTKLLRGRKYKDLEIEFRPIEGIGHSGSKAEGYTRGLQFVFRRNSIALDKSILEPLLGEYEMFPGVAIKLVLDNNQLSAVTPDNRKMTLLAESENNFYIIGQLLRIHFVREDSGRVSGFNLETYEGTQFLKKINK